MSSGLDRALDHLRGILFPLDGGGLSDAQLLARFAAERDQEAFAALVRRYGPLVWGACRRLLGHHDREDVFQAVFLLLAQRAGKLADGRPLGGWLHGVAYRTALAARAMNARRRVRERQVEKFPHPEVSPAEPRDWLPLLDSALNALPEKYRLPVVLCHLQGKTRREAAALMGLPEGTVSSRLATALDMLAKRLARLGPALSGGAVAAALAGASLSAAVSAPLVASTVKAALLVAAGELGAASTGAAVLAKGALKAMSVSKVKFVAAVLAVGLAFGATGVAYRASNGPTAQAAPQDAKAPSELEALKRENELLRLNLRLALEKVEAQDAEIKALKGQAAATEVRGKTIVLVDKGTPYANVLNLKLDPDTDKAALDEVEAAVKALREAKDEAARQRALKALDEATRKLKRDKPDGEPQKR
jgi:RNA polymerase sigma factor (sigma-70 family)